MFATSLALLSLQHYYTVNESHAKLGNTDVSLEFINTYTSATSNYVKVSLTL